MTPAEQIALRDAVHANQACATALAAKDCKALAAIMSEGRTKPNTMREIGNGTILETIGLTAGNALLDVINGNPSFKYVKPLVEQGRLLIGSALVQATLQSLVAPVTTLTQAQADALKALGREPDPYTAQEIALAVFNEDGSEK